MIYKLVRQKMRTPHRPQNFNRNVGVFLCPVSSVYSLWNKFLEYYFLEVLSKVLLLYFEGVTSFFDKKTRLK